MSSGRSVAAGSSAPDAREQVHRLADQGDQVVGAVGETGVVERALLLGDPHGRPPRSATRRLGERPARRRRRSRRRRSRRSRSRSTSVPVKVIAGCSASGRAPTAVAGREHGEAVPARGVHDVLAGRGSRRTRTSIVTTLREHVVGDGEQQQVAGARDGGRLVDVRTPGSSVSMRVRDAADSPAAATISWPAARRAAARTAPTRPAPTTPIRAIRRHRLSFQSQGGYRTTQ